MKKHIIGLAAVLALSLPVATLANYDEVSNKAEFGDCHADPIYQKEFVGQTTLGSRIRSIACMNGSKVLTVLPANTKIKVIAQTDGWYKVKTTNGNIGWVGSWLIKKTSDTSLETKTVKVEPTKKTIPLGTVVSEAQGLTLSELYKLRDKLNVLIAEREKKDVQAETASGKTITLTGLTSGNGVALNWSLNNMSSPNGFKVVVSDRANPVYPGDNYHYLSDSSTRSDSWENLENGTHYFRVCEYLGGKCGVYSNNLEVTIR